MLVRNHGLHLGDVRGHAIPKKIYNCLPVDTVKLNVNISGNTVDKVGFHRGSRETNLRN